jgi:hypothetical protein
LGDLTRASKRDVALHWFKIPKELCGINLGKRREPRGKSVVVLTAFLRR